MFDYQRVWSFSGISSCVWSGVYVYRLRTRKHLDLKGRISWDKLDDPLKNIRGSWDHYLHSVVDHEKNNETDPIGYYMGYYSGIIVGYGWYWIIMGYTQKIDHPQLGIWKVPKPWRDTLKSFKLLTLEWRNAVVIRPWIRWIKGRPTGNMAVGRVPNPVGFRKTYQSGEDLDQRKFEEFPHLVC